MQSNGSLSEEYVPVQPDSSGYHSNTFSGKKEQLEKVCEFVREKGFIPANLVQNEVNWFYGNLGIDDMYFQQETIATIGGHILSLYAAKIFAFIKNQNSLEINLERETDEGAVYIHTSAPGVSQLAGPQHEKRIDEKYLDGSGTYRLESFRSFANGPVASQLRCYFLTKCCFINSSPSPEDALDLSKVSDKNFWEKATDHTKVISCLIVGDLFKPHETSLG